MLGVLISVKKYLSLACVYLGTPPCGRYTYSYARKTPLLLEIYEVEGDPNL